MARACSRAEAEKNRFQHVNPPNRATILVTRVPDGRAPSGGKSSMNPDAERCDGDGMSWDELPALFEDDPTLFK